MSTQQDIYAAGSENCPPMLNKDNYVPWSSCIIRYARSRPNGKMIVDSIENGPYVRRMVATPGELDLSVPVFESFHEQTDEELIENDIKRMDADDQAIQTIRLSLPEDVYAVVDSCETAKKIWERFRQMMKGSDIEEQEKKAKLFNEWEKFTSTEGESIKSYYHRLRFVSRFCVLSFAISLQVAFWSRPNGKMIVDSIDNGPYVRRMVDTPGELDLSVPVSESFHEQTDEELIENDIKRMDADDQAIQTILLSLPEDEKSTISSLMEEMKRLKHDFKTREDNYLDKEVDLEAKLKDLDNILLKRDQTVHTMYMLNPKPYSFHHPNQNMTLGYLNPSYLKKAQLKQQSLYNGNLLLEEHVPPAVYDSEETLELAQERVFVPQTTKSKEELFLSNVSNMVTVSKTISIPNEDLSDDTTPSVARKFLNEMKQDEVNELRPERLAKTRDPLALMAHSQNSYNFPTTHNDQSSSSTHSQQSFPINNKYNPQPSLNQNFIQPPMSSLEDINDPTKAMNAALILFAKAFQLTAPTNNNQRTSSNPRNRQIAQPVAQNQQGYNAWQNDGIQVAQNAGVQNGGNHNGLVVILGIANQNGTGNIVAARAEGTGNRNQTSMHPHPILSYTRLPSMTQTAQLSMVQSGGTIEASFAPNEETCAHQESVYHNLVDQVAQKMALGYRNPFYLKQAKKKQQSLYNGKVLLEKHDPPVMHDSEETLQLAQESRDKMKQMNKGIKPANYTKINHLSGVVQFCDTDLEVAFRRNTFFIRDLDGFDLLKAPVIIVRTNNGSEFKNHALKEYFDSVGITYETSALKTPQQNGVVERINRTLVEAAKTMLIFSHGPLFLWAEAIATACYTQNHSIIHQSFNKTPYELIQGRKLDISYLNVFRALCYLKNDREDIGELGAKGDIDFFIGYSTNSVAYRVYNRRTKKIMKTMNVTFDELSAMAFEQNSSKPGLQSLTSGQISSELELTYAPSTITPQRPSERDLDILFKPLHNEYLGGRPSEAPRIIPAALVLQNLQASTMSMSIQDSAPAPTNSSNTLVSSHNVDAPS
nr:putative RNA-directed DNA polymerase [Tanacetum cinerariifolium]